jgi:hypothetical protein
MLEMKWIANVDGRMVRTWEDNGKVFATTCSPIGETNLQIADSAVLPSGALENDLRVTSDIPERPALRGTAVRSTASPSPKDGNWTRVYSILRSVLP